MVEKMAKLPGLLKRWWTVLKTRNVITGCTPAHLGELHQGDTDPNVYYQSEADSVVYLKPEKVHGFDNVENQE